MICKVSCSISIVFFVATIYLQMKMPIKSKKNYYNLLNDTQKNKLDEIRKDRMKLYFEGFTLGFVISIILILSNYNYFSMKFSHYYIMCFVTAIMFITQYFYYILSPKKDYMILHLKTDEQKKAWLEIYKHMQYNYHFGLVLGIISIAIFGGAFRK